MAQPTKSAVATPRQLIALYLALQRCQQNLSQVYVWGYESERMRYWPGADIHPVPTMVLCLRGRSTITAQGTSREHLRLAPGEALVIAPGVCHEHADLRAADMAMQFGFLTGCADYWLMDKQFQIMGRTPMHPYRRYMESLLECELDERLDILYELIETFLDEHRHEQEHLSPSLQAMQNYLQYNAHLPIGADDIVHASGLQHAQAYALFCEHYKAPPFQVLQQRRVDIAQAHLRAGMAIDEVALCSGFTSRRNFMRAFKKLTGLDPRQWQERNEKSQH